MFVAIRTVMFAILFGTVSFVAMPQMVSPALADGDGEHENDDNGQSEQGDEDDSTPSSPEAPSGPQAPSGLSNSSGGNTGTGKPSGQDDDENEEDFHDEQSENFLSLDKILKKAHRRGKGKFLDAKIVHRKNGVFYKITLIRKSGKVFSVYIPALNKTVRRRKKNSGVND